MSKLEVSFSVRDAMKLPPLPKRPTIPLSEGEVLIGSTLAYVDHRRDSLLPNEVFATNRRIVLSPGIQRQRPTFRLLVPCWIFGAILAFATKPLLGGLFWMGCMAAFLVWGRYSVPKVAEEFPLESVVLCTSENESSMVKIFRVTLVFASGARWRLWPKDNGVRHPRNHLALVLRRAGLVS